MVLHNEFLKKDKKKMNVVGLKISLVYSCIGTKLAGVIDYRPEKN